MGERIRNGLVVFITITLFFFSGCTGCKNKLPEITTKQVYNITPTAAFSGGKIISSGRGEILSCGLCWDTIPDPTIAGPAWTDSTVQDDFTGPVKYLLPRTIYYLRAFATNDYGTGYGEAIKFETPPSVPILTATEYSVLSCRREIISCSFLRSDMTGLNGLSSLTGRKAM